MNILEKKKKVIEKLLEIQKEVTINSLVIEWISQQTIYNLLKPNYKTSGETIEIIYDFLEKNKYFTI